MSILSSFSLQEILKKILPRMFKMSQKHCFPFRKFPFLENFLFWNIFLHLLPFLVDEMHRDKTQNIQIWDAQ